MKAVTFDGKPTLDLNYPDPKVGPDECLVRVHWAGISAADLRIASGEHPSRGVLGHEMVGTVTHGSTAWRGKRVVCEIDSVCRRCDMCLSGLAAHCRKKTSMGLDGRDGCFAEYIPVPEQQLHVVPEAVADEEAVFAEPLAAAYQVRVQCPIEARQSVCVIGAGRLGLLVAQVLKETGCKLMVVGRHPEKLSLCEKRGIQAVPLNELVPRQDRDVVVDCSGTPSGFAIATAMVRPRGTIVLKGLIRANDPLDLAPIVQQEIRILGSRGGPIPQALAVLARQVVDVRCMISRVFPLEQAIEALEFSRRPGVLKVLLRVKPS